MIARTRRASGFGPLQGLLCLLLLALAAGWPPLAGAGATEITGMRSAADDGRSRLVFDLGGPVEHEIFTLNDPNRVVIDIRNVRLDADLPTRLPDSGMVNRIRSSPRNGDDLRVVLDLARAVQPKSFVLRPAADYGHRLVVDVIERGEAAPAKDGRPESSDPARDVVVAIDPGHGGRDPGAIGHGGTPEKDIVLSVARRLEQLLAGTPGFRPVMTRNSDVYLPLRERIRRARDAEADLFVSIHADGFHDPRARGSSVYALSTNGATSEAAKWLANRENSADLVGGVSLEDKDDQVAEVLLDLSQTATIDSSLSVGERVLEQMGEVNRLHKRSVQQAGFVVLKSPDIPSILVETAFISNPHEARQLRTAGHQQDLAVALRDGIKAYFREQAPRGTRFYAENRTD